MNSTQGLIDFLKASPTPFHAPPASALRLRLPATAASTSGALSHRNGGATTSTRNDSSLIAITPGPCSHPAQRLPPGRRHRQPLPAARCNLECSQAAFSVGVEVYGGPLRACVRPPRPVTGGRSPSAANGKLESQPGRLPQGHRGNPQPGHPPSTAPPTRVGRSTRRTNCRRSSPQLAPGRAPPTLRLLPTNNCCASTDITADVVLDYELSFYDTQSAAVVGLNDEFIAGARLDNLLSCRPAWKPCSPPRRRELHPGLHRPRGNGSCSHCGADGPFLEQVLRRLLPEGDAFGRAIQRSLLVFGRQRPWRTRTTPTGIDANHGPTLNGGPVIKINNNQRYATNSETAGFFRHFLPGRRSAGAELRDPQRHGMRLDHRPGSPPRQVGLCAPST
ncbi:M18 family aminopeptidase [Pseudomonas aeruginosa]